MIHLSDITKINGSEAPVVNVIIGGSPCQDLSIAGKRAGLAGERSGLFMEQIRIIKEMREKHGKPRYMVWENVPGAFSSNKGQDFAAVLQETAKVVCKEAPVVPVPKNGWPTAGCITGMGREIEFSIAWRVLDAQFWGVHQRRRRIALVADFGGSTASEILFERKGVSGDSESSEKEKKGITGETERSTDSTGQSVTCYGICSYESNSMLSSNPHSGFYEADTSRTLDGNGGNPACNQGGIAIVSDNRRGVGDGERG